jgi:hypothetical protein
MKAVLKSAKKPSPPPPGPGRPKGLKNKSTQIREAIELGNREYYNEQSRKRGKKIINKFFERAEAGIPWAVQMFIERDLGKVKEFVEVSTPDTTLTVKVVEVKE